MTETDTQHFMQGGEAYQSFRPDYPPELVQRLADCCQQHRLAVDVGCGTGQLSRLLVPHFDQVLGTDVSASQIQQADQQRQAGLSFACAPCDAIPLADGCADLIVAAQAAHWFELAAFYREARRLASADALIVLLSYGVPYLEDPLNSVFQQGYWQTVHHCWPAQRAAVENGYLELDFPFTPLPLAPGFIRRSLNYHQLEGYIRTWSAFRQAQQQGDPCFAAFFQQLQRAWQAPLDHNKPLVWPVAVRAGYCC